MIDGTAPPRPLRRIVAISDFCTHVPPDPHPADAAMIDAPPRRLPPDVAVRGGYLERLPLAAVRAGLADSAEIWSFSGRDADETGLVQADDGPGYRRFRADGHPAPYGSAAMREHLRRHGAPDILCVWGLGVTAETISLCPDAVRIYNSLDVDALRIPVEVSREIDIFLTASPEQTAEVRRRHPDALVDMLPIGPDFASPETFHPLGGAEGKEFDIIYVAAAQPYKRHDILFDALEALPRGVRALCVMGYGELADALRRDAAARGLAVDFVGPPGVSHDEVNRLMNRARIGVVCGVDDGAPAILTEYMLAGLPVLANADLRCGLQYIRPDTGRTAPAAGFATALEAMLDEARTGRGPASPRAVAERLWSWPQSMRRLERLIGAARQRRALLAG